MCVWASHRPGINVAPATSTTSTSFDCGSTGARPWKTPATRSPSSSTSPSKGRSLGSPEQVTTRALVRSTRSVMAGPPSGVADPRAGRERDRHRQGRPVEHRVEHDLAIATVEPEVMEAGQQLLEGDAQVHAGQVRAGAAVGTGAERQVPVALAVEVEGVRTGELGLVPVGRRPV